MASQLLAIYAAIAAIDIVVNGQTIKVIPADEGTGMIRNTPRRVLSPLHDRDENRQMQKMTFGNQGTVDRVITDLCLYAGVKEGSSIEYYMPQLIAYQQAYEDAVLSNLKLGLTKVTVNSVGIVIDVYPYPAIAGQWYYGAKAEWFIKELL